MSDRAFEQVGGLGQLSLKALELRETETSHDDAVRVIEHFGDPDRLLSVSVSLVEDATLGEGTRQRGMRPDGGGRRKAEPLTGGLAGERLQ